MAEKDTDLLIPLRGIFHYLDPHLDFEVITGLTAEVGNINIPVNGPVPIVGSPVSLGKGSLTAPSTITVDFNLAVELGEMAPTRQDIRVPLGGIDGVAGKIITPGKIPGQKAGY